MDDLRSLPDIDRRYGSTPDSPKTYPVITASKDGENVIWKEKVTAEYSLGK